ncbi:hypothetical protein DFQ26_005927 [Actinomortierella ambigua]|nr:hypothetical protein DFQ26_005927 [Actinomortierella ambigua]
MAQSIDDDHADTHGDDVKVKSELTQRGKFWDETNTTFYRSGSGGSTYFPIRGETMEHNPSLVRSNKVMAAHYNASPKSRHAAPTGPVVDSDIEAGSSVASSSTSTAHPKSSPSSDISSEWKAPRRKRARNTRTPDVYEIVDKLITTRPDGSSKTVELMKDVFQDLREQHDAMERQLEEARKELDRVKNEMHDKELQALTEKMAWVQERFDLQLQLQELKHRLQKAA